MNVNSIFYILLGVTGLLVVVLVLAVLYFWFKVMPSIRDMRQSPEGQKQVLNAFFPPRFYNR